MFPDPVSGELIHGISKVKYSHDAMIDLMIAEPMIRQNDIAAIFDRSPGWVSLIINSDAFQARLAERKDALIDPELRATIADRLGLVAKQSLEKLSEKLGSVLPLSDDFLIQTAKLATAALGYGARTPSSNSVNVAVVVQVPPKSASTQEWANTYQVN